MRVKYQTRIISKTASTNGGSTAERLSFYEDIINALIDMGAPLNPNDIINDGRNVGASFLGEGASFMDGGAGLMFTDLTEGMTNHTNRDFYITMIGKDPNSYSNYVLGTINYKFGTSSSKNFSIAIHAIKSGNSFYFGFDDITTIGPSAACINYAITPMRRLSNPSTNLGYAIVSNITNSSNNIEFYIGKTLPYVEGFNYGNGAWNGNSPNGLNAFPEVSTGKISLIPLYAGIEDFYYENIYSSPMVRNPVEEKAFETDKGVFLIGGEMNIDYTYAYYCPLAFDITEAVNSV